MPKYLDLEAHYEADMAALFGIKNQDSESVASATQEQEKADEGDK